MPPYGGRVSGRTVCPFRRGVASSEAEARGAVEGFGGDHPAGPRGMRMGRTAYVGRVLGFFESFPFFQIGRRL